MEYHISNISLDGLLTHGFVLPEGYTWDLKLKNGMKEGKVVVKNQFNVVVAKLEYHNDKLNGLCLFYNNGVLSNKIMFVNDVANGRGCDVEKMKEVRWYLYENGKKKVELMKFEDLNGYWKEMDINTNSIISISHFDENNNKNGRCYLFDRDHISKVIDFLDNQPYRVVKEMKDDDMNEYNDQGDIIYQGQYEDSIKTDYPRLGQGSEMLHKECVYIGEWKDNKKNGNGTSLRDGETYYSGMWKNDLPDGEGFLCDENGELLYQGKWNNGFIKINEKEYFDYRKGKVVDKKDIYNDSTVVFEEVKKNIKSESELNELLNNNDRMKGKITDLVIESNCGNELVNSLIIGGFDRLQSLFIQKNSLRYLQSLIISNIPHLRSIQFDNGSKYSNEEKTFYAVCESVKNLEISCTSIFFLLLVRSS